MSKRFLNYSLALLACMSIFACRPKNSQDQSSDEAQDKETEQAETEAVENASGDLTAELGEKYTICPFCLQVDGKVNADGEPVTETRYWVGMGESVGCSTIADWVIYTQDPHFALNPDGWHFVGKDIVNADETFKINSEDAVMSLSSYCTVRTEKYVKPDKVAPYCHVTRSRLYELVDDAQCPIILTSGNRHQYAADAPEAGGNLDDASDKAQTSFFIQEWVNVTLPADSGYTLALMPYRLSYEGVAFDEDALSQTLWHGEAEASEDGKTASASFYVAEDQPAGFYDLLFIKDQKAQCRLTLIMTVEK